MMPPFEIRRATEHDVPLLAELYRRTVEVLGPSLYSAEQVVAWAATADDTVSLREYVLVPRTHVAILNGTPVGFCGIGEDGHVASLYVAPEVTRGGVGSHLLSYAMTDAQGAFDLHRFYTEASYFSRKVFERHGFHVDEEEVVDRNGALFRRFKMSRHLPVDPRDDAAERSSK